jgi:hydrogenase nickel incorporation protein HypA/HybF
MHEMSLAQNILDIVDEYMKNEEGKLMEVAVEVGELVAVVPESLTFCYEALVENTPYHESKIAIKVLPLSALCKNCSNSFNIEDFKFECPHCTSTDVIVESGQELRISHLEVE